MPDEIVNGKRTIKLGGTTLELTIPAATIPTRRW